METAKFASLSALLLLISVSCASSVMVREPGTRTTAAPTYEDSKEFFLLGLLGPRHSYSSRELCLGKEIDQIETAHTANDVLVTAVTLGIYAPRTLRVWCSL